MSRFATDLSQEQLLGEYLDEIYHRKEAEFGYAIERVRAPHLQHQGIDLIITYQGKSYHVDEKAQLHYLNRDLPTFTFELSYLKDNTLRQGWLFDTRKSTDYYFLVTGIMLGDKKTQLTSPTDIKQITLTIIHRYSLIHFLSTQYGLTEQRLANYDRQLRTSQQHGGLALRELDASTEGKLCYTQHLVEQPINLQLRLQFLVTHHIARQFICRDGRAIRA